MKKIAIYSRKSVFTGKGESVENQIALCKDYCEKFLRYDNADYIVYEDEDILVVNKPADMPIHPSINNYENTLANAVAYYYKKQGETFIFRCINRLDRDTTGLLIIAGKIPKQTTSHKESI